MKHFLKKPRFRRMDEMEQFILFKAQRNSYIFLVICLVLWTFYESYKVYAYHIRLNPFPCFMLSAAAVIQAFSQSVLTRNALKDDEDSYETGPLADIVILACVVAGIIATVIAAIILMGVKA